MINLNIDVVEKRGEFLSKGYTSISNFFKTDDVEEIYNYISGEEPRWKTMTYQNGKFESLYQTEENREKININKKLALESFLRGEFSFRFDVTRCRNSVYLSDVKRFLDSELVINFLNDIAGKNIQGLYEIMFTKYKSNDFLSNHIDEDKGKLAVTIHLTKDWKPEYGGNLHLLEEDNINIKSMFVPKFNNAILSFLPENNKEYPHFVSHVVPDLNKSRYGLVLWYK